MIRHIELLMKGILYSSILFIFTCNSLSAQSLELVLNWNDNATIDSYSLYDAIEINESGDIFFLTFKETTSETEIDLIGNPSKERELIWASINSSGEELWKIFTPCNHKFNNDIKPFYQDSKACLYHSYDFVIPYCSTFYNDTINGIVVPNGIELQTYPGKYSQLYKTTVDFENGTVIGDTLNTIVGNVCEGDFKNDLSYSFDGNDFLHFRGSDQVLRIKNESSVDSLLFEGTQLGFSVENAGTNNSTINFPFAEECGDSECHYQILEVLDSERKLLCRRVEILNDTEVSIDLVKVNLDYEVVESYDYPYPSDTESIGDDLVAGFSEFGNYQIKKFGSKYLLFQTNTIDDELLIATLDSNFEVIDELKVPQGNDQFFFQFISPLEKSGLVLLTHYEKDEQNSSGFGAFTISILSHNLNLLGSKSYQTWESFISLGGVRELDDGYILAYGGHKYGPNNPNDEFNGYLLKENIVSIINTSNIQTNIAEVKLLVFPIPANENLRIQLINANENEKFEVLNSAGKIISTGEVGSAPLNLDVSNFASGIYFIRASTGSTTKFIVE